MTFELPEVPLPTIDVADFVVDDLDRSIDDETMNGARAIVDAVRFNGESSLREFAESFGDRQSGEPIWLEAKELAAATKKIAPSDLALLERVAARIERFATAQLNSLKSLTIDVPGGQAGHTIEPVETVGCYAPAGRFPLPSTVLMTAVTARVAGCATIILASPRPSDIVLAAAHVAGCHRVLAVGGAQAIAALAYGTENQKRCDLICGPGNRWVTAAKKIVNGDVGIDMLAGPSELVAIADESSDPKTVAADLLAQAEHDVDARPILVTTNSLMADAVNQQLRIQLEELATREIAVLSLGKSAAIVTESMEQAIDLANKLAPEHLELHCQNAQSVAAAIRNAGCIFIGHNSAEVFGDYGAGPNHTLPTAGTARWSAGLNVFTFLRVRTWLRIDEQNQELIEDSSRLAQLEGLAAHQAASEARR